MKKWRVRTPTSYKDEQGNFVIETLEIVLNDMSSSGYEIFNIFPDDTYDCSLVVGFKEVKESE